MLDNYAYGSNGGDVYGTGSGGIDQAQAAADLSRGAWESFSSPPVQAKKPEDQILTDQCGHIAQVNHADGSVYQYSNFQANGQPSLIRIIDQKTGDYGQWKREEDGLWRSYDKDKPNHEVVRGEWVVDDKGMMHMQGRQDSTELPPQIKRDAQGHITKVTHEDGVTYDYSKFDDCGQPTVCKITDPKTHDWGYWKKEGDHLWRSYDKEKPNYEVLKGDWTVDDKGTMRMNGVQDSMELPKPAPRSAPERRPNPVAGPAAGEVPGDASRATPGQAPKPVADRPHVALSTGHKIGPGPDGLPTAPPEGYKCLKGHISPEIVAEAKSLLGGAFGTKTPFEVNGKKYMARVEPHYHPEGYKGGPSGWHKGVTVYEAKDQP